MFTLESVVGRILDPSALVSEGSWPPGVRPGLSLSLAGGGKIRLPMDSAGLRLGAIDARSTQLFAGHALTARALVLTQGAFATPLLLGQDVKQPSLPARGKVRYILNAAHLRGCERQDVFGIGRFTHNDAELRPGSSSVDFSGLDWYTDVDQFTVALTASLMGAAGGVEPRPENSAYPWTKATLLLSGIEPAGSVRLIRRLKFAAGLFQVNLQVEFAADSRYQDLTRTIKQRPPNQLLVRDEVVAGDKYLEVFSRANPNGHGERLQPPAGSGEDGLVQELVSALDLLGGVAEPDLPAMSWTEAEEAICGCVKESNGALVLTDRALSMLPENPYPDARRMLEHVRRLADLAMRFREGALGEPLVKLAAANGLDIALFDGSLKPSKIVLNGTRTELVAEPHVKVDDYVSPDRCGRIYFALDPANGRLVIDHIGLHDYA